MRWSILVIGMMAAGCTRGDRASTDSLQSGTTSGVSAAAVPADSVGASAGASPRTPGTPSASATGTASGAPRPTSPPPSAVTDTLRGVAAVVGSERTASVSLRIPGRRSVQLTGSQAALVGKVSGTEVSVRGHLTGANSMEVTSFVVRAVDGAPVRDGVLGRDGDRYHLVLADGSRQAVLEPPARLRDHVGDRVWVSGTAESPVVTFGVIEDRS